MKKRYNSFKKEHLSLKLLFILALFFSIQNQAQEMAVGKSASSTNINQDFIEKLFKRPKTSQFNFKYNSNLITDLRFQRVVNFVGEILSREFVSSVPITVDISGGPLGAGLANATPIFIKNFSGAPLEDVLYPRALANHLVGFDLNPTTSDISANINLNQNFYLGIDGNTPEDKFDLVTILLHEFCHGLGFRFNEESLFFHQLVDKNNNRLVDYPQNSPQIATALSDAVFLNQEDSPTIETDGGSGAILSHLDEFIYLPGTINSLVTRANIEGETNFNIGPIVRQLFKDMGYQMASDANNVFTTTPTKPTLTIKSGATTASLTLGINNTSDNNIQLIRIQNNDRLITITNDNRLRVVRDETEDIQLSINANDFAQRNTVTHIDIKKGRKIVQSIPITIINKNIPEITALQLSEETITQDILTTGFDFGSVTVTNSGNIPVAFIPISDNDQFRVLREVITLDPNESRELSFSINAQNAVPGDTLTANFDFILQSTNQSLTTLPIIAHVTSTDIINLSRKNIDFTFVNTPETTNFILSETVEITNTSNNTRSFNLNTQEARVPNAVTLSKTFIILAPNASTTITINLDAQKYGNSTSGFTIAITEAAGGVVIDAITINTDLKAIPFLSPSFSIFGDVTDDEVTFFNPIVLGETDTTFLGIFSSDGQPLPAIKSVTSNNPNISITQVEFSELSKEYNITYTPKEVGVLNTTVFITLEDFPNTPIEVPTKGISILPETPFAQLEQRRDIVLGQTIIGQKQTNTNDITLQNLGQRNLEITSITSSNLLFTVATDTRTITPKEGIPVEVTFQPVSELGTFESTITISTNDPTNSPLTFDVSGVAIAPSEFQANPLLKVTLNTGTHSRERFSIKQLQGSSLIYDIIQPSVKYTVTSSIDTTFTDISSTGVNISRSFQSIISQQRGPFLDNNYLFVNTNLPFQINYFGESFNTLNISPFGFVSFLDLQTNTIFGRGSNIPNNVLSVNNQRIEFSNLPEQNVWNNIIAAAFNNVLYTPEILNLNRSRSISGFSAYYQMEKDRIIIQWTNLSYNANGDKLSFQMILNANGTVEILYNNVEEGDGLDDLIVGLENLTGTIGNQLDLSTTALRSGLHLKFATSNNNFISDIAQLTGIIPEQESTEINLTISAANLNAGVYQQQLQVVDTRNGAAQTVTVELTVIGEPQIEIAPADQLNFVLDTRGIPSQTKPIIINNTGTDVLEISHLDIAGRDFAINTTIPLIIAPGHSLEIPITYAPLSPFSRSRGRVAILSNDIDFADRFESITLIGENPLRQINTISKASQKEGTVTDKGMSFSPNPAQNNVTLKLDTSTYSKRLTIAIINLTGQTIVKKSVSANSGSIINLPVSTLQEGVYILNVKNEYGVELLNEKLIKN